MTQVDTDKSRDAIVTELTDSGAWTFGESAEMDDLVVAAYRVGGPPSRVVGAGEAAAPMPAVSDAPELREEFQELRDERLEELGRAGNGNGGSPRRQAR